LTSPALLSLLPVFGACTVAPAPDQKAVSPAEAAATLQQVAALAAEDVGLAQTYLMADERGESPEVFSLLRLSELDP
jgi:hypothetical protein